MSSTSFNRIDGVMVSVLTSSAVDLYSNPNRVKPKTINFGMCCFSAMDAARWRISKD